MRLNKFISESGITSRRKAEELILQGRVTVNNKTITTLAFNVDPEKDIVTLDGERIRQKKKLYFLLNKPSGYISTTDDERGRKTVLDLIPVREKLFPVGRLDADTTGVLLLTNDGDFANQLLHPRNKIIRVYEAKLDKELEEKDAERLIKGILLDKRKSKFERVYFEKPKDRTRVTVECVEGRNHFVKRMFTLLGYEVKKLNRKSFAGIEANIPVGSYRELTIAEIKKLYQHNV
ncbi:Ribosomal large subunit pseudouridine synthase B [Ignavibacterium album JCM 16511]|uniref:Pseudouridine synthase n=1 Tax=Ignavibacterium album (strain DSM 19864 / JCM 16511 / NBRC 101810 / Mat9-16) TaxID=945713 RepID=I0AJW0_IGNAJ|nr:pseudouridine synthase [Ignavibacterium album]AFH49267.1 Ribosomal large subunit pseudouridine synthase B [Ignavibacterium album JCM 16511]